MSLRISYLSFDITIISFVQENSKKPLELACSWPEGITVVHYTKVVVERLDESIRPNKTF